MFTKKRKVVTRRVEIQEPEGVVKHENRNSHLNAQREECDEVFKYQNDLEVSWGGILCY